MKTQEAVVMRIKGLCTENTGIVTIKMICDGLNISLDEFFHCGLFQDLEQEID